MKQTQTLFTTLIWIMALVVLVLTKTKPVGAFWQAAATSSEVKLTTGDWRPPAVKVYLDQAGQEYLVKELVADDCNVDKDLTLDEAGLNCTINLDEINLPQFLNFDYQQTSSNGLLTQPGFKLEASAGTTSLTTFAPGVSTATPSDNWRSAWLDLSYLKEKLNHGNQTTLKFALVDFNLNDTEPPKVKLKNLTTLRLVANLDDQLKLKASEPVTWQIDYQVDDKTKRLTLNGQEVTLNLDQLGINVLADSIQIKAVDQAGNESQVLKPSIHIIDDQSILIDNFQLEKETDNKLSFKLDLGTDNLNQVLSWRLREKTGDTWQIHDLVKTVPFLNLGDYLSSVNHEQVVLTTKDSIAGQFICLDALTLTHDWKEVICTH